MSVAVAAERRAEAAAAKAEALERESVVHLRELEEVTTLKMYKYQHIFS